MPAIPNIVDTSVFRGRRFAERRVILSTGGTYTLSPDEALRGILDIQGALASNLTVIFPQADGLMWIVANNSTGAFSVTCQVAASTQVVTQGRNSFLWTEGTNLLQVSNDAAATSGFVVTAPASTAANTVQPTGATITPLTLKGFAAQTAPLQAWSNPAAAQLLQVTAAGVLEGADGTGTDGSGNDVQIAGGRPTGAGSGGAVRLQVAPSGNTGTTLQALYDKINIADFGTIWQVNPGSTDILRMVSLAPASAGTTLQRVPGIFFRGFYWTGSISQFAEVGTDLNLTSTAPLYQWRVVTAASPRLHVDQAGNVTVGTSPLTTALFNVGGSMAIADAGNVVLGTTTGTQFGTVGGAAGQKMAWWGATPAVQPLFAAGAGHTVDQLVTVLQTMGLLRQT